MTLRLLEMTGYIAFFFSMFTSNAYAYLDPGTGSMILQGILAAVAGSMFFLRTYWYKFKTLFSKNTDKKKSSDE